MYSKGISWINDCRIPFVDEKDPSKERYKSYRNVDNLYGGYGDTFYEYKEQQGRFPANILVSDDMLNDGVVSKSTIYKGNLLDIRGNKYGIDAKQKLDYGYERGFNDKGSNSRYYDIDKWFDNLLDV